MENNETQVQLILINQIDADQKKITPMAVNEIDGIKGTKAIDADPEMLRLTIKVAVLKAILNNKRGVTKSEASVMINNIHEEIIRAYGGIRLEEIGLAIHKGAMGEYGQVYNLSMAFFVQSIRTYMQSEARVEAVKKHLKSNDNQKLLDIPKISPEENAKIEKQLISNAFEFFKTNSYFNDYGNYIFNLLIKYGVINFTEEDRVEIWKKARHQVYAYYTRQVNNMDLRFKNRKVVEELNSNKDHEFFYTEAKKIAINKFFSDLKEMEVNVHDLIEA